MALCNKRIEALKRTHGEIFLIELADDLEKQEPELEFVLKKPNMDTIRAFQKLSQSDPLRAIEVVLNDCLVHGDKARLQEPEVILGMGPHVRELVRAKQGRIKKL